MIAAPFPYDAALPLFGFFFICVACGNSLGGVLRTRGALVLGEVSFGIYLLHGILLSLLFEEARPLPALLPTAALPVLLFAAVPAIILLTAITYLAVEQPSIRAGRAIGRRLAGRRAGPSRTEMEVAP